MTAPQTKVNQPMVDSTAAQHTTTGQTVATIVQGAGSEITGQIDPSSSQMAKATNDAWTDLQDFVKSRIQPDLEFMAETMKKVANDSLATDSESAGSIPQPGGGGGVGGYLNGG